MTRVLSETALKNKRKYDVKYMKEKYATLNISMPKDEINDIKNTIKDSGMSYNEFIRLSGKLLKEGKLKRD